MTERERAILDYDENFIKYWDAAFSELKCAGASDNKVWLVGPSSYLFSIGGVKFAVDPQIRRAEDLEKIRDRLCDDLAALSFVLITHQHDDHFCAPLIREVKDLPLVWYLPGDMPKRFIEGAELCEKKCVFLSDGESFSVGDITVSAFSSPHVRQGSDVFMPELGYHIKTEKGSILIPGDIRDYSYRGYPRFEGVDLCFSHLWAGDNAIDEEAYLPMLEKFVDLSVSFKAKRYFICHLYEIGRKEKYLWHQGHAALAVKMFLKKAPSVAVEIPSLGRAYRLF